MPKSPTRRTVLAGASGAAMAAPFVRGAFAAGQLRLGFWDHWVPGANDALRKLCQEWADKEKVDVSIDFITSQGDKLLLTIAG
jgi:ABC-type glycerol-3-phosphate transport system substrate-binding protein